MGEHEVVTQAELTKALKEYERKPVAKAVDEALYPKDKNEGKKMTEVTDKLNIHVGGQDGGGNQAAMIAALLNGRNQGDGQAAMIASLLNNRSADGGFGGGGGMMALLALMLLGRRGFGDGDRDGCDRAGPTPAQAAILQTLMEGVGDLKAAVPTIGLETQNAILSALARDALGTQQGLANVKDAVQTGNAFLDRDIQMVGANVSLQGSQTREWVTSDGEKTRGAIASTLERINSIQEGNLQRELAVAQSALAEERGRRHAEGVEVRVTQNVNQQQAQVQAQAQFAGLMNELRGLASQVQKVQNSNETINFGLMTGSANQANPTSQVNR